MTFQRPSHGATLAALLLAAGCARAPTQSADATSGAATPATRVAAAAIPPLPDLPDDVSPEVTQPLNDAGEIAAEIAADTTVERVPYEGGWAWRKEGQILRTVSADGRRVAYFWPGEREPFLVQQAGLSFAYRGGRVQRAYDRSGRPAPVPAALRDDAERLAHRSRDQRDLANAPRRAGQARPPAPGPAPTRSPSS